MSRIENYCFSANRICHHDDYHLLISKFVAVKNEKGFVNKIKILFSSSTIFYLDIDSVDLFFFPLIILRSLWKGKGCALSVRTEYLLENRTFKEFFFRRGRLIFLKALVKKIIFLAIKFFSSTTVVSIHKGHPLMHKMEPFVNGFIYDPQLWDLEFLDIRQCRPIEIDEIFFNETQNIVLVAGRLNEQRSKKELLKYLENNSKYFFLLAGSIEDEDAVIIKNFDNCLMLNKFLTNEELLYLIANCDITYCFYNNDRPSGFFGRALQLNKPIIVRKNAFLDLVFLDYNKKIAVGKLEELEDISIENFDIQEKENYYKDVNNFKQIIFNL
ncbi:hypothetical protein [Flavobacterium sp.]|uniref:hypothetical protein n=1 Tax=Flavobacterium sp. TaxID=239 RepID=UPI00286DAC9F|nr:hypothetical protein [Flavobacterium sp.]